MSVLPERSQALAGRLRAAEAALGELTERLDAVGLAAAERVAAEGVAVERVAAELAAAELVDAEVAPADLTGRSLITSRPPEGEASARAAVKGAAWLGGERWINQIVVAAVFIALGRLVAPKDFGVIAAANIILAFFRVLVDGGFSRALIQLPEIEEIDVDTAFWTSMGIGSLLTGVTILGSPLLADLFAEPKLKLVTIVLSPIFILVALDSSQSALIDRAMDFRVQAVRRSASTLISSAAAIAVAAAGGGVWALVTQTLVYETLLVVFLWTLADWRPHFRWSRERLRPMLSFGAGITGIRVMIFMSGNADNFLIGIVLGPIALGLYAIAYRIVLVLADVTGITLSRVSAPLFARFQDDPDRMAGAFVESSQLGLLVALPLFTALAVVGDRAVPLLFGPHWVSAGPTAQVLALAGAGQVVSGQLHSVVVGFNRVANELRWNVMATAALIAAFIVTVNFGTVWVALSVGVMVAGLVPVRLWLVCRSGWLPADTQQKLYRAASGPFAAAAVMSVVMLLLRLALDPLGSAGVVVLGSAIGLVAYVAALRLVSPATWRVIQSTAGRLRPA